MRARGIEPGSKLMTVSRVESGADVATALRLGPDTEVLRIERLQLADGEPIAIEVLFMDAERFDGITASPGDDVSFSQLLHSDYGVELESAEGTIEAVVAAAREARLLGCAPGSALLQLSRLTTDTQNRPIAYVQSFYRGDRFRFRRHLERRPAGEAPTLRPGSAGDAEGLAEVFIAAWREGYPGIVDDEILESLDHDTIAGWLAAEVAASATTVVAEAADRRVVGFIRFGEDPEGSLNGYVHSLYVHPRAGGRGVGRRLLAHALAALEAAGYPAVRLWVFEANERARRFYAAAGFVPDGARQVEPEWRAQEIRLTRAARDGSRTAAPATAFENELADRASGALLRASGRLVRFLGDAVASGYPAGATVVVVDAEGELLRAFGGSSCVVSERIPTSGDTMYDLASLTKVVSTVTLALSLAERGVWSLDDPVVQYLEGFSNPATTLRELLTHTSGLPAHMELYRLGGGEEAIRAAVYAEAAGAVAGPVVYSDLGYMLLGWAIGAAGSVPLDVAFTDTVAGPLGMARARYRPPARERRLIAATELDGDQRLGPGLVWGEVHDGNAWALGGVAGHAGLFAPAADVGRFASALLAPDRHPVLSAATIAEMTRHQAGAPPDTRALGWQLDASEWGPWPETTYWHTGFTGTSLLVAPDLGYAVVLLMGGVHPMRRPDRQAAIRANVHRILAEALA
jgi:CubicO group peptidase (beta-lactamase class C family)